MANILHIISSTRGDQSISTQLGNSIVAKLVAAHNGSTVTTIDLEQQPLAFPDGAFTTAMFTPSELRTDDDIKILEASDKAVGQLLAAETIVISLPFINFGIPSTLKAWLDTINRAGITFSYSAEGPKGLITGKKVYIALSSGGIYSEGPMQSYDHAVPFLKSILSFMGITDITVARAEGTKIPGIQDFALQKAIERVVI
jgi:FMN-dependent NADH-azoreductase